MLILHQLLNCRRRRCVHLLESSPLRRFASPQVSRVQVFAAAPPALTHPLVKKRTQQEAGSQSKLASGGGGASGTGGGAGSGVVGEGGGK